MYNSIQNRTFLTDQHITGQPAIPHTTQPMIHHSTRSPVQVQPRISYDTSMLIKSIYNLYDKISGKIEQGFNKMDTSTEKISMLNDRWSEQLKTLHVFDTVDINSEHRNRNQYPLISNFVIPYTNTSPGSTAFTSIDPVTNAYPYSTGIVSSGSTSTQVVIASTSSTLNNFYINSILDINGQYVTITKYVGSSRTLTVSPALIIIPVVGTPYSIRKEIPTATGTLQAGSTQNYVYLPANFRTENNYYAGSYIMLNSGPASGEIRLITSYNGTTKQAIVGTIFSAVPGLDIFEIDAFSYDNAIPLRYNGSKTNNQAACFAIQLLQLSIPNLELKVGYGGKVVNYPFLYVHFYNEPRHTQTIMDGNNPSGASATFRVSVSAITSSSSLASLPNFFIFDNINITAPQSMKYSQYENIRFRITLPSGEDLEFTESDTVSPAPPNPTHQISALVGLKRICITASIKNVY
jgi:hypothetical protein